MMLGGSVQAWYDESIPLEEMYSVDMQSPWFKSLYNIALRKKNLPLPWLSDALELCLWATISNDARHNAETKQRLGLSSTWL